MNSLGSAAAGSDLWEGKQNSSPASARVLVSGASGMIGTSLVRAWDEERIHVVRLVRNPRAEIQAPGEVISWDPTSANPIADLAPLSTLDAAVHLSGANVAGRRWTKQYKEEIVASRVQSTRALVSVLRRLTKPPKVLACASAIGIYGDRGDQLLTEASDPGSGFLAETCVAWERASHEAEEAGIRLVHLRFGVVLSPRGGALAKLLPLFRLGLGGRLGSGQQWMPWLTLRDAVGMVRFCLANAQARGPINAVAPGLVTNDSFSHELGRAVHRPAILPTPAFALRLALGQMADEALLASARVVPAKLTTLGYRFADPEIGPALSNLLS